MPSCVLGEFLERFAHLAHEAAEVVRLVHFRHEPPKPPRIDFGRAALYLVRVIASDADERKERCEGVNGSLWLDHRGR